MAKFSFSLASIIFSFCCVSSHSSGFLKSPLKEQSERVSEEDIRASLLEEVESTLGEGSASNRLRLLEATLKPMFDSLPKNEHGNLGHTAVRYALHRLFVMRHGWNIRGLGFHSSDSNVTSTEGILKDQVPSYLQSVFEKELGTKGLGLHELAVMASALEHLIHKEVVSKLGSVFKIYKVFPTAKVTETQADEMLDTYMSQFIMGENLTNLTLYDVRSLNNEMPEVYSSWKQTQALVRRIRSNVTSNSQTDGSAPRYTFSSLAKVVQAVAEEYGTFQNSECQQLKSALVKMDSFGTGRVKLSDFYQATLGGDWQFQESVAYLRHVGALDESDPNSKSVIIVNYLHSQANCVASSGYYSVCCKDECESLLGKLEETIASPEARPAAILTAMETSSQLKNQRKFPPQLMTRLDDIAALHDGMIPLHGRLFSQWMHHAYPQECPYPHVSGTTQQVSMDDWSVETGLNSVASEEEIREFTNLAEEPDTRQFEESDRIMPSLPWSPEEELLVVRARPQSSNVNSFVSLRSVVLLTLAVSAAVSVVRLFQAASKTRDDGGNHKFMV